MRGDNIICGTTSTGTTNPLLLAATPVPPGGIDFDVFARATGVGFGNGTTIPVPYTIIEFTDNTFAIAKQHEKAFGVLTLGGSSGIANATLTRGSGGFQTTATSLNVQPATQNIAPGSGITIGTAANTLVFIGTSVLESLLLPPYVQTVAGDNLGAGPCTVFAGALPVSFTGTSGYRLYRQFLWLVPMLVKRASIYVQTAYAGGAPVSDADFALYAVGTDGRPGKLLYDFGLLGSAGTSLNTAVPVSSGASGNGYWLTPGIYYAMLLPVYSGGSSGPSLWGQGSGGWPLGLGLMGTTNGDSFVGAYAGGGQTIGAAPDSATLTGWTSDQHFYNFSFKAS